MNTYTLIGSAALKCTRSQRPGDAATTLLVDLSRRTPAVRQTSPLQSSQRRLRAPDVTATVFLAQAATKRHLCRTQLAVSLPSVHDTQAAGAAQCCTPASRRMQAAGRRRARTCDAPGACIIWGAAAGKYEQVNRSVSGGTRAAKYEILAGEVSR